MTFKSWRMFISLTALIAVGLSACDQGRQEPMTIALNDWTGYQPLLLARKLDYLSDDKIHLATLGSSTESLQRFRAGDIDAAMVTLDEALLLKAEGYDISVVMIVDISNGADAIISKPGIQTLQKLKDKRIGVENTALGAYLLARALDKAKLDVADIKTRSITASEQLSAFMDTDIDAVVSYEPIKSQLIQHGGHVIFDSTMIPDEIVDVLIVRNKLLEQDSQRIRQVTKAWFKTLDYMQLHPEETLSWFSQQQRIDKASVSRALDEIIFPALGKNRELLSANGPTRKTLGKMSQIMLDKKLITKTPDLESLLTDRFMD